MYARVLESKDKNLKVILWKTSNTWNKLNNWYAVSMLTFIKRWKNLKVRDYQNGNSAQIDSMHHL